MAQLKGQGRPVARTKGSLGDTYTDLNTGDVYKCTYAGNLSSNDKYEYVWTKTGSKVETVSESNSNPKMQKKQETDTTPETNNSPEKQEKRNDKKN